VVRPAHKHVADGDLAQHLRREIGELGPRGQPVEIGLVLGLDLGNAQAVGVRVVEEVALDAPGLVVDLPPLGAGIELTVSSPPRFSGLPGPPSPGFRSSAEAMVQPPLRA
jgi:hypothetical protein